MEQNNNNNEFEHFLRDSIADFIMIPQRKVWYGIYNHLHPEKKWPSIAVCFCILVSIMHLGISNNKNINADIQQAKNELLTKQNLIAAQIKKDNTTDLLAKNIAASIVQNKIQAATITNNSTTKKERNFFGENNVETNNKSYSIVDVHSALNIGIQNSIASDNSVLEENAIVHNVDTYKTENVASGNNTVYPKNETKSSVAILESFTTKNSTDNKTSKEEKNKDNAAENNLSGYATLVKLPKPKKKKEISYYVTPSIGYRVSVQNNLQKNTASLTSYAITNNYGTNDAGLEDKKAFNFEIGAAVSKLLNKNTKLRIGAQVNYTNYISKAQSLSHPTQSNIAMRSSNSFSRSMDYSATPGAISLNKTTLQISMPIGIEKTILGNERIKWNVAATLQPGVVIAGSGYVLSADEKYYVAEKDLLNRFNLSSAIETFLSIKTASGIRLNVGPQFRYQLTSTYKKNYNYSENLYNIGLKVGVSTNL